MATEQIRDLADAESQVHDLAERIRTSSNINSKQAQELAEYLEDAVDSALGNAASAETASDEYVTWDNLRNEALQDS